MRLKSYVNFPLFIVIALSLLSVHAKGEIIFSLLTRAYPVKAQDNNNFLHYPLSSDPETLNPFTIETITAGAVLNNIFEGLTDYDFANNQVIPALAEAWEVSQDDQGHPVYTFTLRQGVMFHEVPGLSLAPEQREVTADAVLWNYMTALSGDEGVSKRASVLSGILGAPAYTSGEFDTVAGLEVVDRYTLRITLESPDRLFLVNGASLSITSPEAYAQLGEGFSNNPVGTGPFRFVEWQRDDRLIVEANPSYWLLGYPKVAGIEFINYADPNTALLAYQEGRLDFLFNIPIGQREQVMQNFSADFHEIPSLHIRYLGFNMSGGFLAENPLVRQAMSYALDRETAWNILAEGARIPADMGMLPPSMPASQPATVYTYDMDRAAQLLEEAGYPDGEGIPTITLHVLSGLETEPHLLLWQQALAELGIELEFEIEDNATYWDSIMEDDEMIFINGWAAGLNDPSDVFDYLILDPDSALRYQNPAVNDLLRAARAEDDETARNTLYQQAHDLIMADAPLVVSAYGKVTWLQQRWVEGFVSFSGGTHTAHLEEVSLLPRD